MILLGSGGRKVASPSQFDLEQSLLSGIGRIQDMKLDDKQLRLLQIVDEDLWDILEPDEIEEDVTTHMTLVRSGQSMCGLTTGKTTDNRDLVTCEACDKLCDDYARETTIVHWWTRVQARRQRACFERNTSAPIRENITENISEVTCPLCLEVYREKSGD